ncbi:MAG: glycogen debranching enzyme N-terminal domain-containing protein, partial [Turicibacter sp.]
MELTYKIGRGNFRTLQEGQEREWMIGNGIGGYSGQTIINSGFRSFHSYLVAALNAPGERYSIFTRTQEQVIVDGKEYDLTAQQYVNECKNGQHYLNRFTFDSVPTYHYQVEDIQIKKTIGMEYGHNTVAVCYEVKNGAVPASINVVPLFTARHAGATSERSELKFDMTLEGQVLTLIPEAKKDLTISFLASEGTYIHRSARPTS